MSRRRAAALTRKLLELEGMNADCEISVLFCDDEQIRELNRAYRGRAEPTDVLSFPQEAAVPASGLPRLLGDVAISVPKARDQARVAGHSLARELEWLLLHGLLHLLGHEDETRVGYQRMVRRQREALAALGRPPLRSDA